MGAFQARKLAVEGAAELEGTHVHYHLGEPARFAGHDVVVMGGEESAGRSVETHPRNAGAQKRDADAPPRCVYR